MIDCLICPDRPARSVLSLLLSPNRPQCTRFHRLSICRAGISIPLFCVPRQLQRRPSPKGIAIAGRT